MNLRLYLPKRFRWWMASRAIDRAERYEQWADAALAHGVRTAEHRHGQAAIREYLRAHLWYPICHPLHLPTPEDIGSHPADEQLFPEEYADVYGPGEIACVLCGKPIPARARGAEDGSGLYCDDCR